MSLLDFYSDERCALCAKHARAGVCSPCYRVLRKDALGAQGRCFRCFFPLQQGVCSFCRGRNVFFDRHLSLFRLSEGWTEVLRAWKFRNCRGMYRLFLPAITKVLDRLPEFDRISYIGSGRKLYETRSYQPCQDLCRSVSRLTGRTYAEDLRKRNTGRQSSRSFEDRFFALHNSLEISGDLRGKKCLLIEDVFTTGGTANEASRILKKNGVNFVTVLTMLHREDLIPDRQVQLQY